jgi:uncharacterized RDD family membrane protein YckC
MHRMIRLIPTLFDFTLIYLLVLIAWASGFDRGVLPEAQSGGILFWAGMFVVVALLYNGVADLLLDGKTIGKWALGFVAVRTDGRPATRKQHAKRFALKLAGFWLVRGARDDAMPLHDRKVGMVFLSRLMQLQKPPAAGWILRILSGSLAGRSIQLNQLTGFQKSGMIKVGRDPEWADIPIVDAGVSRQHFQIRLARRGLELIDMKSRNGTAVDGHQLPPHRPVSIHAKTKIKIGPVWMMLEPA